jgi:hypothetical protein
MALVRRPIRPVPPAIAIRIEFSSVVVCVS